MGRATGAVTTTSVSNVPVYGGTYNEPASGAQRSLKSSSALDAAAGTGVRTVKITYFAYDATSGAITGPFIETVTLNGTTAVATVATNIAFIEKFEAMTAGSGAVAAGTITLYPNAIGTGTLICAIAAGAIDVQFCHHYIANNKQCFITDLALTGGLATPANFQLRSKAYPSGFIKNLTAALGVGLPVTDLVFNDRTPLLGPAKLVAYVAPATTDSQVSSASLGFTELLCT